MMLEQQEPYRSAPEVATLGMNKKHCFACASVLDVRAELCPKCGVRQPMLQSAPSAFVSHRTTTKSRMAAALFALFLGGLGIHKFYLGQVAAGVLYIVFCWTLIPALISFVESILFMTMSDDTFARRYPA